MQIRVFKVRVPLKPSVTQCESCTYMGSGHGASSATKASRTLESLRAQHGCLDEQSLPQRTQASAQHSGNLDLVTSSHGAGCR